MGAKESGQSFLAGVLAKLPEAVRAQVQTAFEAPEATDAITLIGDGVLARSDYSKQMDALKTQTTELETLYENNMNWWTVNKAALDEYGKIKPEYETLKAGGGRKPDDHGNGNGNPSPSGLSAADAQKLIADQINAQGPDFLNAAAWFAGKAVEHFQRFQETLPLNDLLADPKLGKPVPGQPGRVFSLNDAYTARYGDRLAEFSKKQEDDRIDKLVQERLQAERAKAGPLPFPTRSDPSVLDVLSQKPADTDFSADAAAAEYSRLVSARPV